MTYEIGFYFSDSINDPWSTLDPIQSQNVPDAASNLGNRNNLSTPESFLGDNSKLVNLDNLMGPKPTQMGLGMPPTAKVST